MTGALKDPILLLGDALARLGPLGEDLVAIGGAAVALHVDDPGAAPARFTADIDFLCEARSYVAYHRITRALGARGFSPDPDGPICRYRAGDIVIDVMPVDERILGFSNRWYADAIENAVVIEREGTPRLRCATAPYLLATKIEAFHGRGERDFLASRDMEDIVTLLDGCVSLVDQISRSGDRPLVEHLARQMDTFLSTRDFLDAIPAHLPPDEASQQRRDMVIETMRRIRDLA